MIRANTVFPIGEVIGRWSIVERVRGTPLAGQYLAIDDEIEGLLLVTLGPEQTRATAEHLRDFELRVSGVAPLRGVYGLTDRGGAVYHGLIERVPSGKPLTKWTWPLMPAQGTFLATHVARLVARVAAAQKVLGGIRPEIMWCEDRDMGLALNGLCPRGEPFLRTASKPAGGAHALFETSYSPPEMLEGGPASVAGDVFSACASLVHVLSGAHPFEGDRLPMQLMAIGAGRRRPWPKQRPVFADVLDAGLSVDAMRRPTPEQLVAEITKVRA
jgi:hypothetical protein